MATRVKTTIDLTGPFFTHDPAKTFQENVRTLMEAIAVEGEQDVRSQLTATQDARVEVSVGGRVSQYVRGRVESVTGKGWRYNAVVSVDTSRKSKRGAVAYMAAASSIEGRLHVFRRTTSRLRRARAINKAELFKGLQ